MVSFSIIVPVYNAGSLLIPCLESLANQTYPNIEVILINDGSTDQSLLVCQEFVAKYEQFKLIDKQNTGVSSTRNLGIEQANGDYIMFVDSDDYMLPETCDSLSKALSGQDLLIYKYSFLDDGILNEIDTISLTEISRVSDLAGENFEVLYTKFLITSVYGKCYKRDRIFNRFDTSLYLGEDILFNVDFLQNCDTIAFLDKTLYVHRVDVVDSLLNVYKKGRVAQLTTLHQESLKGFDCLFKDRAYPKEFITSKYLRDICTSVNKVMLSPTSYQEKCSLIQYELDGIELADLQQQADWAWRHESLMFKVYLALLKFKRYELLALLTFFRTHAFQLGKKY